MTVHGSRGGSAHTTPSGILRDCFKQYKYNENKARTELFVDRDTLSTQSQLILATQGATNAYNMT